MLWCCESYMDCVLFFVTGSWLDVDVVFFRRLQFFCSALMTLFRGTKRKAMSKASSPQQQRLPRSRGCIATMKQQVARSRHQKQLPAALRFLPSPGPELGQSPRICLKFVGGVGVGEENLEYGERATTSCEVQRHHCFNLSVPCTSSLLFASTIKDF